MNISYCISVCNELEEIKRLISFLKKHRQEKDEIIVVWDGKNGTNEVWDYLLKEEENTLIKLYDYWFDGNFADMKNFMKSKCEKEYIFNIDADEEIPLLLIDNLPRILYVKENQVDLIYLGRVNQVKGLTEDWINKWGWNVNENGYINFPDYQGRIFRNEPEIKWEGKVHERITGYKTISYFPTKPHFCIHHKKTIEKQIKQNELYSKL